MSAKRQRRLSRKPTSGGRSILRQVFPRFNTEQGNAANLTEVLTHPFSGFRSIRHAVNQLLRTHMHEYVQET